MAHPVPVKVFPVGILQTIDGPMAGLAANALLPIDVTEFGIVTEGSLLLPNADGPIESTEFAMLTEVSLLL